MINVKGELLNSKTEWHQPKIIRITIHTYRLEYRDPMGVTEGLDQPPRRELGRLEAGLCSSLRMDLKGLREMLPGPFPSIRKKPMDLGDQPGVLGLGEDKV